MNIKALAYKIPIARNMLFKVINAKRISAARRIQPKHIGTGENKYYKDIYLIQWNNPSAGLFAYVLNILGELWYAELHGYEPVIDMQTNKNTYLEDDQVGNTNAWEFFFKQPAQLTVADCEKYENVFVSAGGGGNPIRHALPLGG